MEKFKNTVQSGRKVSFSGSINRIYIVHGSAPFLQKHAPIMLRETKFQTFQREGGARLKWNSLKRMYRRIKIYLRSKFSLKDDFLAFERHQ